MSFLNDVSYILNQDFIWNNSYLEEQSANMKIVLRNDGCQVLTFKLDKQLTKEFKGGVFPFFSKNKYVCTVCDYIIFSENNGEYFAIVIELKKGKQSTTEQLNAGINFVKFVVSTVNRVKKRNYSVKLRKVSIKDTFRKRKTKIKDISYDSNSHHLFTQEIFYSLAFLK